MILEWILVGGLFIILTELIYFFIIRDNHSEFLEEKFISMLISVAILWFTYGMPRFWLTETDSILKAFAWYYGIVGFIILFFGSNWLISKHLSRRKK